MKLHKRKKFIEKSFNFGPNKSNNKSVLDIINLINEEFNNSVKTIKINKKSTKYYESKVLMLNSEKAKNTLSWRAQYDLPKSIKLIVSWHKAFLGKKDLLKTSQEQIINYFK
jgi:CDP-glucose 4,6-dehydratase